MPAPSSLRYLALESARDGGGSHCGDEKVFQSAPAVPAHRLKIPQAHGRECFRGAHSPPPPPPDRARTHPAAPPLPTPTSTPPYSGRRTAPPPSHCDGMGSRAPRRPSELRTSPVVDLSEGAPAPNVRHSRPPPPGRQRLAPPHSPPFRLVRAGRTLFSVPNASLNAPIPANGLYRAVYHIHRGADRRSARRDPHGRSLCCRRPRGCCCNYRCGRCRNRWCGVGRSV